MLTWKVLLKLVLLRYDLALCRSSLGLRNVKSASSIHFSRKWKKCFLKEKPVEVCFIKMLILTSASWKALSKAFGLSRPIYLECFWCDFVEVLLKAKSLKITFTKLKQTLPKWFDLLCICLSIICVKLFAWESCSSSHSTTDLCFVFCCAVQIWDTVVSDQIAIHHYWIMLSLCCLLCYASQCLCAHMTERHYKITLYPLVLSFTNYHSLF